MFSIIYVILEPEGKERLRIKYISGFITHWTVKSSQKHQRTVLLTAKVNFRTVRLLVTLSVCLL